MYMQTKKTKNHVHAMCAETHGADTTHTAYVNHHRRESPRVANKDGVEMPNAPYLPNHLKAAQLPYRHLSIAPSRATSQRLLANQGYSLALRPISNSPLSARNLRSWPLDSTQPRHHATAVGESMRTHLAAPNI
jgi:hypothetical protein